MRKVVNIPKQQYEAIISRVFRRIEGIRMDIEEFKSDKNEIHIDKALKEILVIYGNLEFLNKLANE